MGGIGRALKVTIFCEGGDGRGLMFCLANLPFPELKNNLTDVFVLYRQECLSGNQNTRKVHTKLHPGLE